MKIRGRRKEKEKLPSGITADYSASFFAQLDRDVLDDAGHQTSSGSVSYSLMGRTPEGLAQSDSSEASLTSLTNAKNLPPLPPKPPKRGILKGPRLSVGSVSNSSDATSPTSTNTVFQNGSNPDNHHENNLLQRNTLQNEVIAYQNLPLNQHQRPNKDELQLIYSEDDSYREVRQHSHHHYGHPGHQDTKLLHVS